MRDVRFCHRKSKGDGSITAHGRPSVVSRRDFDQDSDDRCMYKLYKKGPFISGTFFIFCTLLAVRSRPSRHPPRNHLSPHARAHANTKCPNTRRTRPSAEVITLSALSHIYLKPKLHSPTPKSHCPESQAHTPIVAFIKACMDKIHPTPSQRR
jgi:hypothetical protein